MVEPERTEPEARYPVASFDRRRFLQQAVTLGAVSWVAPLVVTVDAAAASASPAPQPVVIVSTASGPIDLTQVAVFSAPHDSICPQVALVKGNERVGKIHIESRQPYRSAHPPWGSIDAQATEECLNAGAPKKTEPWLIEYVCCRFDVALNKKCCRIVKIDPRKKDADGNCLIVSSFDTCDGSLY